MKSKIKKVSFKDLIYFSYTSYRDYPFIHIFLLIQFVIILIVGNILTASINGKMLLYNPYKYILDDNEGVLFRPESDVACPIYDYNMEYINDIVSNLNGKSQIHASYQATPVVNSGEYAGNVINIYAYEDEFIDMLKLPLKSGKWNKKYSEISSSKDTNVIECIIPSIQGYKVGDTINTDIGIKLKVTGILEDLSYEPLMISWSKDIYSHYKPISGNSSELKIPFAITRQSSYGKSIENFLKISGTYIVYDEKNSFEENRENDYILLGQGQIMKISTIRKNSRNYLYKDINDILPIIICGIIIICISIVSSISILFERQYKKYKIFFLCGATRKDGKKIMILGINMMLLSAGLISMALLMFWNTFFYKGTYGMEFQINNILVIIVFVLIFELVIFCVSNIRCKLSKII